MTEESKYFCMGFMLQFYNEMAEKEQEEATERILDALIDAVEKENAGVGGGIHPLGSNRFCEDCRDYQNELSDT